MSDDANVAGQRGSWRPSQSWWVVGAEGIVALAIGIFIVARPADASDIIRVLIAVALLVVSLGQIGEGFRDWNRQSSPWSTLSGGVGVTAALLTILANWSAYIPPAGARQMLAVGLIGFGGIGLISLIFTIRATGFKIAALILDLLAIALGILLLRVEADDSNGTQLLGGAAIVGGVALLIYGYTLWSRSRGARVMTTK
jgi:uncharacterized membrane protein HdeD (DUF308 family)